MKREIKVLHLFNEFLPLTEVWCFDLLSHIPKNQSVIGARDYLYNEYFSDEFTYIKHNIGKERKAFYNKNKTGFNSKLKRGVNKILKVFEKKEFDVINRYINQHEVDLIHCHFGDVAVHFYPVLKNLDIPIVVSFYGIDYEYYPFKNPSIVKGYKKVFSKASMFLCEGLFSKKKLVSMGAPIEKVFVQRLGVPIINERDYFENVNERPFSRFVQIASFAEKKGQLFAIRAFAKALDINKDLTLTFTGNIRNRAYFDLCIAEIRKLGIEKFIEIDQFIELENIDSYLKKFDFFIHPSCYTSEKDCEGGAPTILFHAQLAGLPVLSTYHCDIPSVVIDGVTGELVEEKAYTLLADKILRFSELSSEEYKKYAFNGIDHIKKHFNIGINAKELKNKYLNIINAKRNS